MIKKILFLLFGGFFVFLFALCTVLPPKIWAKGATESLAECVIETTSRRFLFEKNADSALPLASTTKILTAIIILEDCDPDEIVTVPKEAERTEGSSAYLRTGEDYSVRDLLYGLMLRSGNDCAVTLALHHSGTIEKFARRMNEKAAMLGAENSNFINPHGLPDSRHYTTAHDLAIVSAYAMENETFREIVSAKYYAAHHWKNKNKMLWNYDGAIGIKTGFTINAGRCLVTCSERDGMRLVCVVLNSPQMYERTAQLLDGAYADYQMTMLCDSDVPIEGLRAKFDFSYPLKSEELLHIRMEIVRMQTPVQTGDFVGQMKIFLENDLIFSQNLYMIET